MKRRKILWKKVFLILGIIIFIGVLFYVYFKTWIFTINKYEIVGVKDQYIPVLKEKFEILDKQKLYGILPGNRVISYHNDEIKSSVRELLLNTEHVSVMPVSFHTLKIYVRPYVPLFRINDKQAINQNAVIYSETEDISKLPTLSFSTSSKINSSLLFKIVDISPKVSASLFDVKEINVNEYNDIYIKGGLDNRSAIIFSSVSDIKKIWSNLVSAIDTDPLKSKLEKEKDKLEYLDTRFGNKIFYKFTNETQPAIIGTHATTTATTTISQ